MLDPLPITPIDRPFDALVRPPGSKSLTNRALLLAALAEGESRLTGLLFSDDSRVMLRALDALGIGVEVDEPARAATIRGASGRLPANHAELDLRNSGTSTRFLAAACCLAQPDATFRLDGNDRMRQRPIGQLVQSLRELGADVEYLGAPGRPPLRITARPLGGDRVELPTTISSQYVSALLQIGPCLPRGLAVDLLGDITSPTYIDMTAALARRFGADVQRSAEQVDRDGEPTTLTRYLVAPTGLHATDYDVEPDASGASYFLAAAAMTPGARCTIQGVGSDSLQGDARFAEVLAKMGAAVSTGPDHTTVEGPRRLRGVDVSLNDMPDMAQTLAALAVFAEGPTLIRDVGNLRVKETDRIAAIDHELSRIGVDVDVDGDDIRIAPPPGGRLHHPGGEPVSDAHPADIQTYDDHRVAMSMALVGLRRRGIRIIDPGCVAKTYPDFFHDLATLPAGGNTAANPPA